LSWLKEADNEFACSKLACGYFYIRLLASAPMEMHRGPRTSSSFAPAISCQRLASALTHRSASPLNCGESNADAICSHQAGYAEAGTPESLSPRTHARGVAATCLHLMLRREKSCDTQLAVGWDVLIK